MAVDVAVEVSWIAVVAGTVGYQALGALWYGPLFGDRWMAGMGFEGPEEVHGDEDATTGYLLTTVGSLVAVVALVLLVDWTGASTPVEGLSLGVVVGVGFVATTALQAVPFEGRAWSVYLLNAGYNLVALAGVGVLLVVL
jgi:hypothetical protein